mgnify:CR=1 FL=1
MSERDSKDADDERALPSMLALVGVTWGEAVREMPCLLILTSPQILSGKLTRVPFRKPNQLGSHR